MNGSLRKLVSHAGPALQAKAPNQADLSTRAPAPIVRQLLPVLNERNGFYAFEAALHFFPDRGTQQERGMDEWNSGSLWRDAYAGIPSDTVFFAEDVFGAQFCFHRGISVFDPETGAFEVVAPSLEAWAAAVLEDAEVLTGYPLAHEWQEKHGPIPPGHRLVPVTPFAMGGAFDIGNLQVLDSAVGMNLRASIAAQIRDLPDGTVVKLAVTD